MPAATSRASPASPRSTATATRCSCTLVGPNSVSKSLRSAPIRPAVRSACARCSRACHPRWRCPRTSSAPPAPSSRSPPGTAGRRSSMSAVGPRRPDRPRPRPPWLAGAERLDLAVYAAIAATPSPALDSAMGRLIRGRPNTRSSRSSHPSRLGVRCSAEDGAGGAARRPSGGGGGGRRPPRGERERGGGGGGGGAGPPPPPPPRRRRRSRRPLPPRAKFGRAEPKSDVRRG
jgi:hypothetical protein